MIHPDNIEAEPALPCVRDTGVPLGGIGAGKVEWCPDGAFRHMTCANNTDWPISALDTDEYRPGGISEAFLAAAVEGAGAVMLKAEDAKRLPGVPIERITFEGMYPFARLGFPPLGEVELSAEAFSPILLDDPHPQYLNSSLPAVILTLRATNRGTQARRVALAFSWPHLVGLGGFSHCRIADLRGNDTQQEVNARRATVRFIHNRPKINARVEGAFEISALAQEGTELSTVIDWWYTGLFERFGQELRLPGTKTEAHLTDAGAVWNGSMGGVAGTRALVPGETFSQTFLLSWHFPRRPCNDRPDLVYRNMYARFLSSVTAVTDYVQDHLAMLREGTLRWQRRLTDSNLPRWFTRKLINNICTLSTGTVYADDGRFSCNESPATMNGCMGTLDQRTASNAIHTLAFPRLAKAELEMFSAAQITEDNPRRFASHWNCATGAFDAWLDRAGAIPHDIGRDDFEGGMGQHHHWLTTHWPDLGTVYVLQIYAQAAWTGDMDLLRAAWPRMLAALSFQQRLDQNNDGIADLWGHGCCTYDSKRFRYYGASPFIATLHLAALRCAQKVARMLGDEEVMPELRQAFDRNQATLETRLWNQDQGQYDKWLDTLHANWAGTDRAHHERSTNRMIAQVAGAWFVPMLDLEPILDNDRLDRVLDGLYRHNVAPTEFCAQNEVGPDPFDPHSWPYYAEVYYAANAIYAGRVDQGMDMVERFSKAMFEHSGRIWDARLRWNGAGNGTPDWGRWYMSSPSSWFVLLALVGVHYDALTETLTVRPAQWSRTGPLKKAPVFHPLFWATLDVDERGWALHIDKLLDAGKPALPIRKVQAAGPEAMLNGEPAPSSFVLHAGDTLRGDASATTRPSSVR